MHLNEYLDQLTPKPFRPAPLYFAAGDYLTYVLKNVPYVTERLDDDVTVYLAADTRELVGFKVKGVNHILGKAGTFGVGVEGGDGVRMGLFFFAGAAPDRADKAPKKKWYDRLEAFADVKIDRKSLGPV